MNYWIFQSNPKKFDVDNYIKDNKIIFWTLRQEHFKEYINIGDIVYIWRSDGTKPGSGGIIAKCKVIDLPTSQAPDDDKDYWIDKPKIKWHWYVKIEILEFRLTEEQRMIKRTDLKKDSNINNLAILKFANNTNYLLKKDEGEYIESLWNDSKN